MPELIIKNMALHNINPGTFMVCDCKYNVKSVIKKASYFRKKPLIVYLLNS